MYKENFIPDQTALKNLQDSLRKKEELMFMSLCSESDLKLLLGEKEMSLNDFERLTYLMDQLGFQKYCIYFQNQHPELLQAMGEQIECDVLNETADVEASILARLKWDEEFLDALPTKRMRLYFRKFF